jgi:hypothetical protein
MAVKPERMPRVMFYQLGALASDQANYEIECEPELARDYRKIRDSHHKALVSAWVKPQEGKS